MTKKQKFDERRFETLIMAANMTGNYHIEEIGRDLSTIADVVLSQPCFRDYSDEWRGEMRSVAYMHMMDAIKNVDTSKGRAFSYMFNIANKACRRQVNKLKRYENMLPRVCEHPDVRVIQNRLSNPAVISELSLGGVLPVMKYKKENPCNRIKKAVLLRNVINRAVEAAIEMMEFEQIEALFERAARNRRLHAQ